MKQPTEKNEEKLFSSIRIILNDLSFSFLLSLETGVELNSLVLSIFSSFSSFFFSSNGNFCLLFFALFNSFNF